MERTKVLDSYWRFAAERHAMYERRLRGEPAPWTEDPVLANHRFTNSYRAADRVSQYLISEVQYREDRSQAPAELVFRTLLFKTFNKVETWELIERELGPVAWQSADLSRIDRLLEDAINRGQAVYSAAYIMPSPAFGRTRKHGNHLALIDHMMRDNVPGRIARSASLAEIFEILHPYPGLGRFLAFQYAIDINYAGFLDHGEDGFVVAGPGAHDGISKCFSDTGGKSAEDIIHLMTETQDNEFARLGLAFGGLFGRPLQPIDCQNLFCEISKYAREAHPDVAGVSGRTKIKQGYKAGDRPLARPFFPPRWSLAVPDEAFDERAPAQATLF